MIKRDELELNPSECQEPRVDLEGLMRELNLKENTNVGLHVVLS